MSFRYFLPYAALLFIINHSLFDDFFEFAKDLFFDNSQEE